jgi:hypothetical protein
MNVRETLVEKIMAAGHDTFTSCEEADRIIEEFKKSGEQSKTFGIMAGSKCVEVVTIARKA